MTKIQIKITKTPDNWDSDNITFLKDGEPTFGKGFKSKDDGNIALTSCPLCVRENYYRNVLAGQCTWCDFNVSQAEMVND